MPSTHSLRDNLLGFLAANPTAWRIKSLAEQLRVDSKRLEVELAQLSTEGKVVSCTVQIPGSPPELEYRLATSVQKLKANNFVINRETNVRFRQAR